MNKLLLADDSVTIQKVVGLVLADEGFELKITGNGKEAIEALSSFRPDVVLADVEMPEMNGYELARAIKGTPATSSIPVILMAGAFETIDEDRIREAGADDYVIKPFESQDLISKLRGALTAKAEASPQEEPFAQILSEAAAVTAGDLSGGLAPRDLMEEVVSEEYVEEVREEEIVAPPVDKFPDEDAAIKTISLPEAPPEAEETRAYPFENRAGGSPPEDREIVSPEEIKAAVEARVAASVEEALGKLDLQVILTQAAAPVLGAAAQKIVEESLPSIVEPLVSEALAQASAAMKEAMERIVRQTVPELAESIIRQEMESIKSEALAQASAAMKEAMERIVRQTVPELAESIIRQEMESIKSEALVQASAAMKEAMERIVRQTVPELAESIIRQEIESIKREI